MQNSAIYREESISHGSGLAIAGLAMCVLVSAGTLISLSAWMMASLVRSAGFPF